MPTDPSQTVEQRTSRAARRGARRPGEVKLRLRGGPEAVALARHSLNEFESELGPALFEDMRLLLSELVTNSVRHAVSSSVSTVSVEISVRRERVRVCVTDPGPGFEAIEREPGADPGSGWGLFLVEQLSHRWGVDLNGGTSVWFEIDRARGGLASGEDR
jgi:anti-sigma regulatory factor (Ser/Thr protein kinase)